MRSCGSGGKKGEGGYQRHYLNESEDDDDGGDYNYDSIASSTNDEDASIRSSNTANRSSFAHCESDQLGCSRVERRPDFQ
jgi:hypothetical protein